MLDSAHKFSEASRRHGDFTLEGNSTAANVAYEAIVCAVRELRLSPDGGLKILRELTENNNPSSVTWAALFLLPLDEPVAMAALRGVAESGIPRLAFNARMTLSEWKAGRLKPE